MYTLLLRIGAPMQSWGSGSCFNVRETNDYPTKSGITGMIAAALGRNRDERLDDLNELRFGVRIDCPGRRITDYQIAHLGEGLHVNASTRDYLCDAVFVVGLESEDLKKLDGIKWALEHPIYRLSLGRRSCPPTPPLIIGIIEQPLYNALYGAEWQVSERMQRHMLRYKDRLYLRIITESKEDGRLVKDKAISFSPFKREYAYRYEKEEEPKIIEKG